VFALLRLSERRATFVSSATCELRTPLATLQLSTDMRADGMGQEESKRHLYCETLRREADRPGHQVENVPTFRRAARGDSGVSRGQR
jgi:signal transduction histidine kinase